MDNTVLLLRTAIVLLGVLAGVSADRKAPKDGLKPLRVLLFALPFACGGFYTYLAPAVSAVLLYWLCRRGRCVVRLNLATLALCLLAAGFVLTPLWAADKGMASFGGVRFFPVILYAPVLCQLEPSERKSLFALVPLSGVLMTALSFVMQRIGSLSSLVTVGNRLSGFFEYPNTFALFLLVGFVLTVMKAEHTRSDWFCGAVLLGGIFAADSRATLLLLLAVTVYLCVRRRSLRLALLLCGGVLAYIALAVAGMVRFESSSFTARLLFYTDALPVIAKNPFGLGYYGYRAVLSSIRTAPYAVTYVHNGFLQLLLEVGWVPAAVFAAAVLRAFFAKTATPCSRLLLFVLIGHALVDFDLQYLLLWLLLLPLLDLQSGTELTLQGGKRLAAAALAAVALPVSCLLGAGAALYRMGKPEACLAVTPFHTEAELTLLQAANDTQTAQELADSILRKNKTCVLALNAKANTAFSDGAIEQMMAYKEQALACDRYSLDNYLSYIRLLLWARELYLREGNEEAAEICCQKALQLPALMRQAEEQISPLAQPSEGCLALPQAYAELLNSLDGS